MLRRTKVYDVTWFELHCNLISIFKHSFKSLQLQFCCDYLITESQRGEFLI